MAIYQIEVHKMRGVYCSVIIFSSVFLVKGADETRTQPTGSPVNVGNEKAFSSDPSAVIGDKSPLYLLQLAEVHARFGAQDLAKTMLEACVAREKGSENLLRAYMLLGSFRTQKGDYQGGIKIFEDARKQLADSANVAKLDLWLADAYRHEKMYDSAENLLNGMIVASERKRDREMGSYAMTASSHLTEIWQERFGDLDRFLKKNADALWTGPEDGKMLEVLGDIFRRYKRDPAKAETFYDRAVKARPHDTELIEKVCRFLEINGKIERTVEMYGKLLEEIQAPELKKQFLIDRATLMLTLNKREEAIDTIRVGYQPSASYDYAMLAGFYEDARLVTESEVTFEKGNKLAANDQEVARNKLYLAKCAFRRKDYDRAEEIGRNMLNDYKGDMAITGKVFSLLSHIQNERGTGARKPE